MARRRNIALVLAALTSAIVVLVSFVVYVKDGKGSAVSPAEPSPSSEVVDDADNPATADGSEKEVQPLEEAEWISSMRQDALRGLDEAVGQHLYKSGGSTPLAVIKMPWEHGVRYDDVRQLLDTDDLLELYELLEDPQYQEYWHRTAEVIAYLSDRPNEKTADVLLAYSRRQDDWSKLPEQRRWFEAMGKIRALSWVGMTGTQRHQEILRKVLDEQGAIAFAEDWINGPLPAPWNEDRSQAVANLQGYAAIGLVYAGGQENWTAVEHLYRMEHKACIEEQRVTQLYNGLITAMAERDVIEEVGLDRWMEYSGQGGDREEVLQPHIFNYAWHLQ